MPQSLAHLAVHLVFSTKNREPFIDDGIQPALHAYLVGILKGLDCVPIQTGGVLDHVHLLFGLSRTRAIADVTRELKTNSTNWLRLQSSRHNQFHWQSGYGVFSISASNISSVKSYIANQREHHRKMTFQDEYRSLLVKHDIVYDERYVWD
ncbi:putative transposase [Ereboglobus sp. PH5-5]|uniref:IS200/IS605 family transposase n=1 Tax=Ereboglobus sp. PH5-5 TaxID=2940529 RepID=UPI00240735D1|nr:IS200/IS605 family transposase [Ereboglobus sp. PH5-5]MDF9833639.1 putative transposase [Ereboglobus sp. PH5-5]